MQKGAFVAYFDALSRHLLGGTEANSEKSQDSQCSSRDSSRAPPSTDQKFCRLNEECGTADIGFHVSACVAL
jgi:hypothetical protein